MFAWAGVGFGQQESYHLSMSLRRLATETPSIVQLRLWGKILGLEGDYYVAEGVLESKSGAPAAGPPALPGTAEYDVEPRGEGANTFTYWVATGACAPWVRLPNARASHIVAARQIKHFLTGNLDASVHSMPWFPGKERHLLRAQIARISATCTLATRGWYEPDDSEPVVENKIRTVEDPIADFVPAEELVTEAAWVHASPHLLKVGKTTIPDPDALEEPPDELREELTAAREAEGEALTLGVLGEIAKDLEDMKPEDSEEALVAWSIKVFGDKGVYNSPDPTSHQVVAVRSLIWPGAVACAQGKKFANIYVGYAMKTGTLVPRNPTSGLPLQNTSPFSPLEPEDICEEPADLEEHDEPNPQEDDNESDKGSVDDEEAG